VGRLRLRLMERNAALDALERARRLGPSVEGLLDLALAYHLAGDVGGEVSATTQAVEQHPESVDAWSRHAHALARTDRMTEGMQAAERALALGADGEVGDLLERLRNAAPRVLPGAA
jgi:predicted Zn-dependent protease